MTSKTFEVPNIGCAGCVAAIKMELEDLSGVQSVSGDVPSSFIFEDAPIRDAFRQR